jgi:hypothetical protein
MGIPPSKMYDFTGVRLNPGAVYAIQADNISSNVEISIPYIMQKRKGDFSLKIIFRRFF